MKKWLHRYNSPRQLIHDENGGALIVFGVSLAALMGVATLAIDAGHAYVMHNRLQSTADAAALAAATAFPDEAEAKSLAQEYSEKNMPLLAHGDVLIDQDVVVGNWDRNTRTFTPGGSPMNAVRAITRRTAENQNAVRLFFAGTFGVQQMDVVASSIAGWGSPPNCLLALEPTAGQSIDVGNGTINGNNCGIRVNSNHPQAVDGNANGGINVDEICITGGYTSAPHYSTEPDTGCPRMRDPLSDLQPPTFSGCDYTNKKVAGHDETLLPGVYCGGLELIGNVQATLEPGIYIMEDGPLKTSGTASLAGVGIGFYLTGTDAVVQIEGTGTVSLSAPETGPMAGVLFFEDRDNTLHNVHRIRGEGSGRYEGAIYLSRGDVELLGNGALSSLSPVTYFVAQTFRLTGNGILNLAMNPSATNLPIECEFTGQCVTLLQ
jgi:Flp pilus assembly protein TadG